MALAVIPTWAAPAAQAIRDAHRIAQALGVADPAAHTAQAVAATFGWVTGRQPAPLTGRRDGDMTAAVARSEMMLASAIVLGSTELPADVWVALEVEPARALTDHRAWAGGVGAALGWLLGITERAPVALPVRGPDGRPVDAVTLYESRIGRHHRPEPEQRRAAWAGAQRDAALYARLAELADSVSA